VVTVSLADAGSKQKLLDELSARAVVIRQMKPAQAVAKTAIPRSAAPSSPARRASAAEPGDQPGQAPESVASGEALADHQAAGMPVETETVERVPSQGHEMAATDLLVVVPNEQAREEMLGRLALAAAPAEGRTAGADAKGREGIEEGEQRRELLYASPADSDGDNDPARPAQQNGDSAQFNPSDSKQFLSRGVRNSWSYDYRTENSAEGELPSVGASQPSSLRANVPAAEMRGSGSRGWALTAPADAIENGGGFGGFGARQMVRLHIRVQEEPTPATQVAEQRVGREMVGIPTTAPAETLRIDPSVLDLGGRRRTPAAASQPAASRPR
jgi:hypothetical protein